MSSPNVIFSDIPDSILKPGQYFEFNLDAANNSLPTNRQKVLIIGESNQGIVAGDSILRHIFSSADAAKYHGEGTVLHIMAADAIAANKYMDLYTYGTVANYSTARTYTVGVSTHTGGMVIDAGVFTLRIGRQTFRAPYVDNAALDGFFDLIASAVNASSLCPFSAAAGVANEVSALTLTAKTKGSILNQVSISFSFSTTPSKTFTGTNTAGVGDSGVTADMLADISSSRFAKIIIPWSDSGTVNLLRDYLREVSGPTEQRPGIGVVAFAADLSLATALAEAVNDNRIYMINYSPCAIPQFEMAAAVGAVLASHENPNVHFDGEEIPGMSASDLGVALSASEQETLLANGVTPLEAGSGDAVCIVRAVATYTTESGPFDLCTITSLDYEREALVSRMKSRFRQANITDETLLLIEAEALAVLKLLEEMGVVQHVDDHKDEIIAERDSVSGRANLKVPSAIVPGLHVLAGQIYVLPL